MIEKDFDQLSHVCEYGWDENDNDDDYESPVWLYSDKGDEDLVCIEISQGDLQEKNEEEKEENGEEEVCPKEIEEEEYEEYDSEAWELERRRNVKALKARGRYFSDEDSDEEDEEKDEDEDEDDFKEEREGSFNERMRNLLKGKVVLKM